MRLRAILTAAAALALSAALFGCGGNEGSGENGGGDESTEIPGGADPEAARVIDEWSTSLREGDIEAAADYFEVPSIAENGTPPVPLDSREEVIAFNESLPCGAELTSAGTDGQFTIATFELTERPGPGECGPGTGNTAKTAFVIEDGLITVWRRVADDPVVEPPAESPVV
jgi:hypothetical protein